MGRNSSNIAARKDRSLAEIERRIGRYYFLQHEILTPLLHKELSEAIKLHEEGRQHLELTTAEHDNVFDELEVLDKANNDVTKHWEKLHRDMKFRITILASMFFYQQFFTLKLLLDYGGRPPKPTNKWFSDQTSTIDKHYNAASESEPIDAEVYENTVVKPLEELMWNRLHVEKRLRIAATMPSYPTGDVHRLIDHCDWSSLASTLVNDRELAVTMFSGKPVKPGLWSDSTSKLVLDLIDEIQGRYFEKLLSPSLYALNKRARDLSAKKAAQSTRQLSGQHPSSAITLHYKFPPAATAAKNIYHKAVRRLRRGEKDLSPRYLEKPDSSASSTLASQGSTAPLIDSREKVE